MTGHAVIIAGGGPTGLTLAAELALARIDVAIVERRTSQKLAGARAGGLHARTIEMFDQRGIAERFISQGQAAANTSFGWIPLDLSDLPSRHACVLALWQQRIEEILAGWIEELGVPIHRGIEVTGFARDDCGVDVSLSTGASLRAEYLVGCDGGRSVIRKTAGIEFPGWDPTVSHLIAEVQMREDPDLTMHRDARGIHSLSRMGEGDTIRVMVTDQRRDRSSEPTLADLSEALIAYYGSDFGIHNPSWISGFTDMTRQAERYREGRVLLAGDAAHVHYSVGGQGLNIGVQDAMNLGWKLAQVVKGISPDSLLDTYHAERHSVAASVLRNTMAQVALLRVDDRTDALRNTMTTLLAMGEPRRRFAAMMSGLDVHYDLGEEHPLLGRRMPDLDLDTVSGPTRVYTLLHGAHPVLLNLGVPGDIDISPWIDRVPVVDARYDGPWELPAIGTVTPPAAVLIRPDGYVAWVGDRSSDGPREALTTWFGPPAHSST